MFIKTEAIEKCAVLFEVSRILDVVALSAQCPFRTCWNTFFQEAVNGVKMRVFKHEHACYICLRQLMRMPPDKKHVVFGTEKHLSSEKYGFIKKRY